MRGVARNGCLSVLAAGMFLFQVSVAAQEPGQSDQAAGPRLVAPRHAGWKGELKRSVSRFGHRNWIVIADAAYPEQSSPGIHTISTNEDHLTVVQVLLDELRQVKHVRPVVYLDAELPAVPDTDAPGIGALRTKLNESLRTAEPVSLPHEEIIAKLDEAGKTFKVLILKTNLTLPYTSVFVQLDCGYWSSDAEKRLRAALEHSK